MRTETYSGDPESAPVIYIEGACSSSMMEVCSKPSGNTDQGLCDTAGNALEWVEDDGHFDYDGAPVDGSAWLNNPRSEKRVMRGGDYPETAHVTFRFHWSVEDREVDNGFRLVR